jgi:thiamine-monophosphate kinase
MPKRWSVELLTGLYSGLSAMAQRFKVDLAGGDMSSTTGPAVISITVVGRSRVRPLARAQAESGWSIGVTGSLGRAAVALREHRPYRLVPLIDVGRRLNELALCCGDISDGLVREMEKFAALAGVGCVLRADDVPRADGASVQDALSSGEEAELVCAGPEARLKEAGLQLVGKMTPGGVVEVVDAHGTRIPLASWGYDHFG